MTDHDADDNADHDHASDEPANDPARNDPAKEDHHDADDGVEHEDGTSMTGDAADTTTASDDRRWPRIALIALAVVAGVGVFFAGAALGDAISDDPEVTATASAPVTQARPVAAPGTAAEGPASDDAGPDGSIGESSDAGGQGPGGVEPLAAPWQTMSVAASSTGAPIEAGDDPAGGPSPDDPDTGDTQTDGSETDEPGTGDTDVGELDAPADAPTPGAEDAPDGIDPGPEDPDFRFVDPCAGERDDDLPQPVGCPGGVSATVLGDEDTASERGIPMDITRVALDPTPMTVPHTDCLAPEGDGVEVLFVTINRPAEITVRYGPGDDRDREASGTLRDNEIATANYWIGRGRSGHPSVVCLPVDVSSGSAFDTFTFDVTAVAPDGSTDTQTFSRPVISAAGRAALQGIGAIPEPLRRTIVHPLSDWEADIIAAHDVGESVRMAALPRTGPDASNLTCTDIELDIRQGSGAGAGVLTSRRVEEAESGAFTLPASAFGDPPGTRRSRNTIVRFRPDNGVTYDLCTFWVTGSSAGVRSSTVIAREVRTLEAPVRFDVTMAIVALDLRQPVTADFFDADIAAPWSGGATFPATALDAGDHLLDDPVQVMNRRGAPGHPTAPIALVTIASPSTVPSITAVPTPLPCDPSRDEICLGGFRAHYEVDLPGGIGTATIVVNQRENSGRDASRLGVWGLEPGDGFDESSDVETDLLLLPVDQQFAPDLNDFPHGTGTFRWEANFPVEGTIAAVSRNGDPTCDVAPAPVAVAQSEAAVYTVAVELTEMCVGARYHLVGNLTTTAPNPLPPSPEIDYGERGVLLLETRTEDVPASLQIDVRVLEIEGADELYIEWFKLGAHHSRRFSRGLDQYGRLEFSDCLSAGSWIGGEGSRYLVSGNDGPGIVPRDLRVTPTTPVRVLLELTTLDDSCPLHSAPGERRSLTFDHTFTVDELFDGTEPTRTTVDVEGDGIRLRIRLIGRLGSS